MDSFMEYLVKKKSDTTDIIINILIVAAGIILAVFVFMLFMSVAFLRTFSLLAGAAVLYGAYILIGRRQIEYEYIFTNGCLDIDIIRAKRARKRMISIICKEIENMEISDNFASAKESGRKIYNAIYSPKMKIYKIETTTKGERAVVFFQPPKALVDAMYVFNPRCIKKSE